MFVRLLTTLLCRGKLPHPHLKTQEKWEWLHSVRKVLDWESDSDGEGDVNPISIVHRFNAPYSSLNLWQQWTLKLEQSNENVLSRAY